MKKRVLMPGIFSIILSASFFSCSLIAPASMVDGATTTSMFINNSGTAQWARTVSAGANASQFYGVAVDSAGNIYAAGYQSGTGTFTYGSQSATGTFSSNNVVLVKYDASGTAQWARTVSAGPMGSQFNAVAVDSSGNIYAAGFQSGTGTFTYGSQSATGTTGSGNVVLVKYDASGTAQWARTVGAGANASQFNAVTVDSSGNIYAAGFQSGTGTFTYGSQSATGTYTGNNVVLVKYDASGTAQWAQTVSAGSNISRFSAIAVDSAGSIYAAGYQDGTGAFSYGSQTGTGTFTGDNAVLVKYDASGTAQWVQTVSVGLSNSQFSAVTVNSGGSIYAAGYQNGTGTFTYGGQSAAGNYSGDNVSLVKYDASGTAQWAQTVSLGTNHSQFGAVTVDSAGNIYAAGHQNGIGTFTYGNQSAAGTYTNFNIALVKYDASGTAQWARTVSAGTNTSQFSAVTVDSAGTVYAVGNQIGTGTFTYGSQSIAGTYAGGTNVLMVKYQ